MLCTHLILFCYRDSEASVVFLGLLLLRQTFEPATFDSAVVFFCYIGNNSNTHTMDGSELISVLSEGSATVKLKCTDRLLETTKQHNWHN